jgi:hypothetical protein
LVTLVGVLLPARESFANIPMDARGHQSRGTNQEKQHEPQD